MVEQYSHPDAWREPRSRTAHEVDQELVGPPSPVTEDDEQAERSDILVLRLQLAAVDGDPACDRLRGRVQRIAAALSEPTRLPGRTVDRTAPSDVA